MKKTLLTLLALLMVTSLIMSACAPKEPELTAGEAAMLPFGGQAPPATGAELVEALDGKYEGTVVTMVGPFTDADAVKFEDSVKSFEDQYLRQLWRSKRQFGRVNGTKCS